MALSTIFWIMSIISNVPACMDIMTMENDFAFFSKAILEMLDYIDYAPDIIHCNDWQTALVPVYLNLFLQRGKEVP